MLPTDSPQLVHILQQAGIEQEFSPESNVIQMLAENLGQLIQRQAGLVPISSDMLLKLSRTGTMCRRFGVIPRGPAGGCFLVPSFTGIHRLLRI